MNLKNRDWGWPFSLADLTAGLRRYLGDTSVRVTDVEPLSMPYRRPAIGRLRALKVDYTLADEHGTCRLVVKEPRGTTRTGLAGAGRREVGVYQSLASHLPIETPTLIAASSVGDWLLMLAFQPARDPGDWAAEDYRDAIEALVDLHDRFWALGEDFNAFPWLGRPLAADYEVHVAAAAKAIERIVAQGEPEALVGVRERMQVLAALTMRADRVVAPLRNEPTTLLHGDYWPGNIAILEDERQIVYDWQLASIGPGVMDLLVFVNKSTWWFDPLPLSQAEIITHYRERMAGKCGVLWEEDKWEMLWDHAMMWRFLQEWVDLLAASPESLLEARADQLDEVWLNPVAQAVTRRIGEL
ncbi:MAG: phosphotransferase [Anaerolineales bacterium]|nr:phosphotransferase [Anaerolineales bacterium]